MSEKYKEDFCKGYGNSKSRIYREKIKVRKSANGLCDELLNEVEEAGDGKVGYIQEVTDVPNFDEEDDA